jgi:ABC-type branched-subunit amino acid transport system substrate-binding protein
MRMLKITALFFTLPLCFTQSTLGRNLTTQTTPLIVVLYTSTGLEVGDDYNNLNLVAEFAFNHFDQENHTKSNVRIIGIDDKDDPAHALEQLKKLAKLDRPTAIIGPIYSNVAMGIKSFIEESKIPLISIFATHNDLTKGAKNIFRICASNRRLVKAMADFLVPEAQKHHLTINAYKDLSDDYSIDLTDNFRMLLNGVKVAYNEVLFRGIQGLDHLQDLNSKIWTPSKNDIIFLTARDDVAGHIMAAIETEPYMVASIDPVTYLGIAKKIKSEKVHIRSVSTSQWLPGKSAYSKLIEEDFKKHFQFPLSITTALTYDAALTVAAALHRAQAKVEPIDKALRDGTQLKGVTGPINLGRDGERVFSDIFFKESFIE